MRRSRRVALEGVDNMQESRQAEKVREREMDNSRKEGWGQGRISLMDQHGDPVNRDGREGASFLRRRF